MLHFYLPSSDHLTRMDRLPFGRSTLMHASRARSRFLRLRPLTLLHRWGSRMSLRLHSCASTRAGVCRLVLCVAPIQPFRMNERLAIQQGLFLCPAQVSSGFEDNLQAMSLRGAKFEKLV